MGNIQILDEHVANQIAAGEVVERPSSVVKELVENAIDAGARAIQAMIEEGGVKSIRVVDDGSGMTAEDLGLAFERHATSKIRSGKDLFAIRSLGFRGEALPSIAAVSRVECLTCGGEDGLGHRLVIEGGARLAFEPAAAPRGTDFRVNDLFYNTPARLKYLKTVQTELGHITDFMYRLALARPDVSFRLEHNGALLLDTSGNGELLQAAAAVYGTATAKRMIPFEAQTPDYKLSGLLARPDVTRSNRAGMTVVVNGRYVRSYPIAQAVLSGYHTLLPINRYPLAILHLEMEPALVDVNVHPAKLEVRFSKDAELSEAVQRAVREALRRETLIPSGAANRERRAISGAGGGNRPQAVQETFRLYETRGETQRPLDPRSAERWLQSMAPVQKSPPQGAVLMPESAARQAAERGPESAARQTAERGPASAVQQAAEPRPASAAERRLVSEAQPGETSASLAAEALSKRQWFAAAAETGNETKKEAERDAAQEPGQDVGIVGKALALASENGADREAEGSSTKAGEVDREAEFADRGTIDAGLEAEEPDREAEGAPRFPHLYPIGQLHGTYIVAQNEDGLFLVDQHAAHERINYEAFYKKFGSADAVSQLTMFSITLEFTSAEAQTLRQRLPLLESVGVYLEPFGGNTFKVTSHPSWFPQGDEADLIEEMAQWVLAERSPDVAKIREASAIMCSCKASIKANQAQSIAALHALLQRLAACSNPFTCPHGRPIVVSFSKRELEKMFKRVM